jgi:NADPH2:quinone reductase
MVKVVQITQPGGPEVLQIANITLGAPGPGELLVRHHAVGLNFVDVYNRNGMYKQPAYPCGIGAEAAGVIEKVGPKVKGFKAGDRVAYGSGPLGAYSEARIMPAASVMKLPKEISYATAAAMMLKGMTVEYLLNRTYKVKKGQTVLMHAAAGGVGLIFCQWARKLGVTVIGTVGSDEKAKLAKANGCKYTINYATEDFVARVKEITKGKGVPVVYDSVGKDTFERSLDCLAPTGMLVSFGSASGPVPPFQVASLAQKGSLYVTRPTLFTHASNRETLEAMARNLFRMVKSGAVKIRIEQTYPLAQAAQAQIDLVARKTTGSTVLIP